ncbi:DUF4012 domain-containing protein [Arthrobacter sp. CJ23]|uniref:DUF4012 domain-containing protein n=1 Tax=Arthrobacter sp. CJ23 TaxID=2972479 RepID=UPI00215C2D97|nr:DUF4012 domain-containing protein [Arthrobacter sp. CJ23]UVJ38743.1 DUF4012 domain-containing protein [Arthrobacter sp. CJ23]
MSETRQRESEPGTGLKSGAPGTRRRRLLAAVISAAAVLLLCGGAAAWLGAKASTIEDELAASMQLIPELKDSVIHNRADEASAAVAELKRHTAAAREAASDPLWSLASAIPWLGANFAATTEIARSADDVATLGVAPLVQSYGSLDWDKLLPSSTGADLEPLRNAAPSVSSAAHAVRASAERLDGIDTGSLLPQIAGPLAAAREQLRSVTATLDAAANAAQLAPAMMGADKPRHYLLLIQNNSEARATGGIPGALAILTADKGKLSLSEQSSATELGRFTPPVPVEAEQQRIYTSRMGTFMQDVNFTPDFPTSAATALAMWEERKGRKLDGAVSIDPVALGYILDATGPVTLKDPHLSELTANKLPQQLTGKNVVRTLLSDVYAQIEKPALQDAYFAAVAQEIFGALSTGKADAPALLAGVGKGVEEHRILLWSGTGTEQSVLAKYPLSGSISGPSVPAAQFGAYFNDGTGAKMDYHVKRTVQLIKKCVADGYRQVTVRVTSTNTAPADAATSLPEYVTGGGAFGVPAGTVRTNVVAYGPAQARVETTLRDGGQVPFGAQLHGDRPVGTLTVELAPGQSSTVDFNFSRIVQHTEPTVVATPTTQSANSMILATQIETCSDAVRPAG